MGRIKYIALAKLKIKIHKMVDFREHFRCKFGATEPKYLGSTKILISECWRKNIFLRFIGSHITASKRHRFRLTDELSENHRND